MHTYYIQKDKNGDPQSFVICYRTGGMTSIVREFMIYEYCLPDTVSIGSAVDKLHGLCTALVCKLNGGSNG